MSGNGGSPAMQGSPLEAAPSSSRSNPQPKPSEKEKDAERTRESRYKPLMQDRQARGKDRITGKPTSIFLEGEESAAEAKKGSEKRRPQVDYTGDSYEATERRAYAATILDTPELLMMHANIRQDTLPSTRYHFMKMLCGVEGPPKERKQKAARSRKSAGNTKVEEDEFMPRVE